MINKRDILKNIDYWVDDFPTLPTIYTALSDVLSNPRSTANDAAAIISQDQSSSAKLLKIANSSIYGFRTRLETVSQAIFYIGFEEVKNIILAISIMDIFKATGVMKAINPVELWKHSISVGVGTRLIGTVNGIKELENFFIAGILHDIGKLLFIRNIDKEYAAVVNLSTDKGISIRQAEMEILGISHTVAGELIAEKWKLSQRIKTAISNHHSGVDSAESENLTAAVHLANIISKTLNLGFAHEYIIDQPNINIWQRFKMNKNDFISVYPRILNDYEESLTIFNISM
jgi:HD-like signal output (HDOD) protein